MCNRDMVNVLFPHLAAVEIEQIDRQDGQVRVTARPGRPGVLPLVRDGHG
ncbi:hypothetical protein B0I32_13752 [Nonomuraea fuscirosea]|uniref:Uncharacterized protein n=1 Tax=Nonomuraea fuscirosea TaxID=1291556 RepID=A0A2T0M1Y2_9ACTN|nr:hypothetical protein B0I32_13752 [Nonomuraea fuscirosea]